MAALMEHPTRVLLVEDTPYLRVAFSRLLRLQGFEVMEANDGQDALDCLETFHPELILTDLMMPVMGGLELIKRLHGRADTVEIPIVAITADASDAMEEQVRLAGAVDLISKPVDLAELLRRLRNVVPICGELA